MFKLTIRCVEKQGMLVCLRIGVHLLAVLLFSTANGYSSDDAETYEVFKQGLALERQLKIYEARDQYAVALSRAPQNTGYLSHYAWFLTSFGFSEEAIDVFNRLLPLTEDKDPVYIGLGWNRQILGRLEASLNDFTKRFPISASNLPAAFEQIRWHLYQENYEKIRRLKKEIDAGTDTVATRKELVKVYLDQGELNDVISLAQTLRDRGELDLTTQLWLARARFWSGDKRRAEKEYAAVMAQTPGSAFLHMEIAEVLISDNRLPEARVYLEKALVLYPGAAGARKKLAEVLARLKDDGGALSMAETITTEGNSRLTGLMARARALHFSGHVQTARHLYAMVLKEYPYYPDALWGMTETSIYSGRFGDAQRTTRLWENALPDSRRIKQMQRLKLYTAPIAKTKADYYDNSSDFSRKNIGQEASLYVGDDLRLDAGYQFSEFSQDGFEDVFRHAVFFGAQQFITENFRVDGRLSGNFYDSAGSTLNGSLGGNLEVSPTLSFQPRYRHVDVIDTIGPFENMVYSHTVTIGSVGKEITADELGLRFDYRPSPRLSFSGNYVYSAYSDGNHKQNFDFEAGYRFSLRPDWRIAYNFFYLDYRDPAPLYTEGNRVESAYYDPTGLETHGLRLVFRNDDGRRFFYGGEGALSFVPENSGIGTYLSAFTEWRPTEEIAFRLDARWFYQNKGVDRLGDTGFFWADNILFEFDYRF